MDISTHDLQHLSFTLHRVAEWRGLAPRDAHTLAGRLLRRASVALSGVSMTTPHETHNDELDSLGLQRTPGLWWL